MQTFIFLITMLTSITCTWAQIGEIPLPRVDTLEVTITQRVFMSVNGSDSGAGTRQAPKRTFAAAMAAIPWPTAGAVYAEIVLLPGTYHDRFVQRATDLSNGTATRNVSIRGEGTVILNGTGVPLNGVEGVVTLRGSHIAIRNVHVVSSPVSGIAVLGPATDVVMDSVSVDTCISHGLYFDHVDRGRIEHSAVHEAAASGVGDSVRAFGSAIKLFMSKNLTVRDCISTRNWGEGVNINRTERCLVERCHVGDNYGIAFYLDMAAVCVVRNNRILNDPTDRSHWAGTRAASGISLSNELHCAFNSQCDATWTGTENCMYHCQGFGCDFWVRMNDSCFIYNNLIVNAGTGLEMFELFNVDCFRTIEFTNNTVVGCGDAGSGALLWFNLGMLFHTIENVKVRNNLFLMDDESLARGAAMCRFNQDQLAPVAQNLLFTSNTWNRPAECGLTTASDAVVPFAVAGFDTSKTALVDPLVVGDVFGVAPTVPYVTTDLLGRPRRPVSSIGALEGGGAASGVAGETMGFATVRPNPASDEVTISVLEPSEVTVIDITGRIMQRTVASMPYRMDCSPYPTGIYLVRIGQGSYTRTISLCIVR